MSGWELGPAGGWCRRLLPPLPGMPALLPVPSGLPRTATAFLASCIHTPAGKTISHIKQVPGWSEKLASDAEAVVKAEHVSAHGGLAWALAAHASAPGPRRTWLTAKGSRGADF